MRHIPLEQLCKLYGGFNGADVRQHAKILGTNQPAKMGRIDWTPGHPVGDVAVIKLSRNAPVREPRESIPYLYIFEGASEEEVGFLPLHILPSMKKCSSSVTGRSFIGTLMGRTQGILQLQEATSC